MNKLFASVVLTASLLFFSLPPRSASAAQEVGVEFFYKSLSPHGEWLEVGDYGYCWRPTEVGSEWRPYTVGSWVYTDAGWTWDSDEPFGWIVFHYGRWFFLDQVGWCWVPDTRWAPAWVSFRHSDEHIGWAPLPPEARLWTSIGIGEWVDAYYDIGPDHYCFVPARRFSAPLARSVIVRIDLNITLFASTTNVTGIRQRDNHVFVGGPRFEVVSARSEWPMRRMTLVREEELDPSVTSWERRRSKTDSGRFLIPAPRISATAEAQPPKIARTIRAAKVQRGWEKTADPEKARELKAKLKSETNLPSSLPPAPKFERSDAPPELKKKKGDDPDAPPATRKPGLPESVAPDSKMKKSDAPPATRKPDDDKRGPDSKMKKSDAPPTVKPDDDKRGPDSKMKKSDAPPTVKPDDDKRGPDSKMKKSDAPPATRKPDDDKRGPDSKLKKSDAPPATRKPDDDKRGPDSKMKKSDAPPVSPEEPKRSRVQPSEPRLVPPSAEPGRSQSEKEKEKEKQRKSDRKPEESAVPRREAPPAVAPRREGIPPGAVPQPRDDGAGQRVNPREEPRRIGPPPGRPEPPPQGLPKTTPEDEKKKKKDKSEERP